MNVKHIFIILNAAIFLTACFSTWQGDDTTITLRFGNAGGRSSYIPYIEIDHERLSHTVTLSGSSASFTHDFEEGVLTATISVSPGRWEIEVEAFYEGKLYAAGKGSKVVLAGQNNYISIDMDYYIKPEPGVLTINKYPFSDDSYEIYIFDKTLELSSMEDFLEAIENGYYITSGEGNSERNTMYLYDMETGERWEGSGEMLVLLKQYNDYINYIYWTTNVTFTNGRGTTGEFKMVPGPDIGDALIKIVLWVDELDGKLLASQNGNFLDTDNTTINVSTNVQLGYEINFDAEVNGVYDNIQWLIWGIPVPGSAGKNKITIHASDFNRGAYQLMVMVDIGSISYSAVIAFNVQ